MRASCLSPEVSGGGALRRGDREDRKAPAPFEGRPRPDAHADLLRAVQADVGSLVAVARHILGGDDLAWDAVQEALLILWVEGERPPNPRAWLVRTVVHRSLHLRRCRARRRKHEERASLGRSETSDRDDPSRHLEGQDLRRLLQDAFAEMAQEHVDVLALKWLSDLDYASIAERLQIPSGTVRSRLNRSRKALRQVLSRRLPEADLDPFFGRTGPRIRGTER